MISFEHISKTYDPAMGPVFSDFNAVIDDGEFVLITGKSGSGKSTLLKLILKEIEPDFGRVVVNKQSLSDIKRSGIPAYRRNIGVVFQDFRLFDDCSIYANLDIAYSLMGGSTKDAESRIINIMKLVGIDHLHKRYPKELSGGEQQKVCLARALINQPYVLLADEPTGNLDPKSSMEIFKIMELAHRHGTTVIMATHDLNTASRLDITARTISLDEKRDIFDDDL